MQNKEYTQLLNKLHLRIGLKTETTIPVGSISSERPALLKEARLIIRTWAEKKGVIGKWEEITVDFIQDFIEKAPMTVLLLERSNGFAPALIELKNEKKIFFTYEGKTSEIRKEEIVNVLEAGDKIIHGFQFVLLPEQLRNDGTETNDHWTILSKLVRLLRYHKREIGHILIYALIAGIISLSLPLGVQSIISYVSSGQIVTSVVILIIFIVTGLLLSGGMQYMQMYISEHIQQKIFATNAFAISRQIPNIRTDSVYGQNPREIMNRFFEVITLQKGISVLLLELSAASLQTILGILLISFYHPAFIFPGLILILLLVVVLRLSGPQGLKTSLKESKYKYSVARWLEELAGSLRTFKLTESSEFVFAKTDHYVSNYLLARKKHFRILSFQYFSFILFKTLITGGLLGVGCYLVVRNEISLGQFVAAEISIILVMGAVEKLILKLDTVYDLLTSIEKLSQITELPIDANGSFELPNQIPEIGLNLEMREIRHCFPNSKKPIIDGVSFQIKVGQKICLVGPNGSGKTTLMQLLLGVLPVQSGSFTINGMPYNNIDRKSIIPLIGHLTTMDELFNGTVLENITLGRPELGMKEVMEVVEHCRLSGYIEQLPEGFNTRLVGGDQYTSGSVARKILLARCLIGKPSLIFMDSFLTGISRDEKQRLMADLMRRDNKTTLVMVTANRHILENCDEVIILDQGKIVAQGPYARINNHPLIRKLVSENNAS
jgi:ABC-type bacteriocin/lantibiotic exporter with double-glycine peptidase domain